MPGVTWQADSPYYLFLLSFLPDTRISSGQFERRVVTLGSRLTDKEKQIRRGWPATVTQVISYQKQFMKFLFKSLLETIFNFLSKKKKKKDKRQNKTQKTKQAWIPELQFLTKKALGNFWLKKTFLAFVVCLLNFQICCYCLRKSVTVDLERLLSPIWLPNHGMISICYHAWLQLFFSWLWPKIKTISSKLNENCFFFLSGAQLLGANFNTWLMNKSCSFQNLRRHW